MQGAPPQYEVETVRVVRPLKIIALICCIIAILLLIISVATSFWLESDGYRQGLFEECFNNIPPNPDGCHSNAAKAWIQACAALSIIAMIITLGGTLVTVIGLISKDPDRKSLLYKIAMGLMFFAALCLVIALIVFPAMFVREINSWTKKVPNRNWYFSWGYGIAWGSAIFMVGAAILLILDRESDEIYYKEKNVYYDNRRG